VRSPYEVRQRLGIAALIISSVTAIGCGSRGDPLPPLYPNPPAIVGLTAAQRGTFAVLRFPEPPLVSAVGSESVELEAVEVLQYAERYPVLNIDALVAGLERRRDVMVEDTRAERAAAAARAAAEAAAAAGGVAGAAGEAGETEALPTTVRTRTRSEDLIHRLPPDLLAEWEAQGVSNEVVLVAAQQLVDAVGILWDRVRMPSTILDPDGPPPPLPAAGLIAAESADLFDPVSLERPLAVGAFVARASVARSIPVDQFEDLLTEDLLAANRLTAEMLQVAIPVGAPAPGDLRTRYFFAVRGRSDRQVPGQVTAVVALAPVPVPVAPDVLLATVGSDGIELSWEPPSGDVTLRRLDPETLRYNVYRMAADELAGPTPLNPVPLTEPEFTDNSLRWGETYIYEVRALVVFPGTLQRESAGTKSTEVLAIDTFPPGSPGAVRVDRALDQVTLQWAPSASLDIVGYRVYRHPFPAPPVPSRYDPTVEEEGAVPAPPPRAAAAPAVAVEGATEPQEEPNEMVAAGWELLTENPVISGRFTDRAADPQVRYVYAVEAIDAAGNVSALAVGTEGGDVDR